MVLRIGCSQIKIEENHSLPIQKPFPMSFFRRLFQKKPILTLPPSIPFMGAGCVFTDGKHVLAGYQPHKKNPGISGIGGHKEGDEIYLETAYRETIEEIFHITTSDIPRNLIPTLQGKMTPRKMKMKEGYVILTFTFEDLSLFLKLCKKSGLRSPVYTKIPKNLIELLLTRQYDLKAEISCFALLPVIKNHPKSRNFVDPLFIQDMWDM
jgi:hypothetical protein